MEREEKLEQESLEEQVEELRKETLKVLEFFLPPKEVRKEVLKNLYTIELSFWRIVKTLVDYEVGKLERRLEGTKAKEKVKRIEVE
ncbi:MAG: hypothetical protein RMH93_00555 [Aquificaceae bacterium]|nr:hypothetical protein [Aquificaceae bacterium]MDW8032020.1 hypothetical protein [Aquificaceae bacterium]